MAHCGALEALVRSQRDIRNNTAIIRGAGLTVVLTGDFRQILPIIPRGRRADDIYVCLEFSLLWRFVRQLSLSNNMRAHLYNDSSAEEFFHQHLQIGNGALPLNNTLQQHVLQCGHIVSALVELKEKVFPTLQDNFKNIACVDKINHELLHILLGDVSTFVSIDTTIDEHAAVKYLVEFLNSLQPTGLPPHKLFLKKVTPTCT
uniref:ATP-dependent DNA helicase n=1 Tax=Octopus bimaculoides TaxID=37653 RepID=A0A0L8I4X5_OCTBM